MVLIGHSTFRCILWNWKHFKSHLLQSVIRLDNLSTLVISIDAPLRMLLDNEHARQYIPTNC